MPAISFLGVTTFQPALPFSVCPTGLGHFENSPCLTCLNVLSLLGASELDVEGVVVGCCSFLVSRNDPRTFEIEIGSISNTLTE